MKKIKLFFLSFLFLFYLPSSTAVCLVSADTITKTEPKVYITAYGDCYHHPSCGYLWSSRNAIGLYKAQAQGYHACTQCGGKSDGTISVSYYQPDSSSDGCEVSAESIVWLSCTLFFGIIFYVSHNPKEK